MKNEISWQSKFSLIELNSIDSTNDEAKRIVAAGRGHSVVITATHQTAGRGRYGRKWESGTDNLYMSVLLPVSFPLEIAAQLSFVMGLSVHDAISNSINNLVNHEDKKLSSKLFLKWPNDIFLDNKKMGGILLETVSYKKAQWCIIGVGINVTNSSMERAISLSECGAAIDSAELMNKIMVQFEEWLNEWLNNRLINIRKTWLKHAYLLGKEVKISNLNSSFNGIFEDIDETGAIILRFQEKIIRVTIGEMLLIY